MNKSISNKALQTKEKITEVAEHMFIENGYNATTLREIAKKAGVTTGAFYKHYKCKEDILVAIFNEGFTKQWEKFYELNEDLTPVSYAKMVAEINNGLAQTFGVELLKVYCMAQIELGNQGSLWKVLDTEKYSMYDEKLLESLANKYSTHYSWDKIDSIIAKVDRGVILDWLIQKGSYDLGSETETMLLMVFKIIFDKWNWD